MFVEVVFSLGWIKICHIYIKKCCVFIVSEIWALHLHVFLADNALVHKLLQIEKLRTFPDVPYREYLPDTCMSKFHTWSIWIE